MTQKRSKNDWKFFTESSRTNSSILSTPKTQQAHTVKNDHTFFTSPFLPLIGGGAPYSDPMFSAKTAWPHSWTAPANFIQDLSLSFSSQWLRMSASFSCNLSGCCGWTLPVLVVVGLNTDLANWPCWRESLHEGLAWWPHNWDSGLHRGHTITTQTN